MKIATYNINGVNGRLTNLLRWLEEAEPDVVCLQELKCTDSAFPEKALRDFGYHAIWHGQQSWNGLAILSRYGKIQETRRGLDGGPDDTHSRYIETFINGVVIGCLYLPNGNPYPGPKLGYKIKWIMRLTAHAQSCGHLDCRWRSLGIITLCPPIWIHINRKISKQCFVPSGGKAALVGLTGGWLDGCVAAAIYR